jgi:hypothetical protein
MGNGTRVLFWIDRWIYGRCAEEIAPLVAGAVPTRRRNNRLVSEALTNNALTFRLRLQSTRYGTQGQSTARYFQLDLHCQWCLFSKGQLSDAMSGEEEFSMHTPLWRSLAPLKCKIFCWLALRYKLDFGQTTTARPSGEHGGLFYLSAGRRHGGSSLCNAHTRVRSGLSV